MNVGSLYMGLLNYIVLLWLCFVGGVYVLIIYLASLVKQFAPNPRMLLISVFLCSYTVRVLFCSITVISERKAKFLDDYLKSYNNLCRLLPSPKKEVMFLLRYVCLFVCPSDNWKSCERILTKFLGGVRHGPSRDQWTHFWWRSPSSSGSRSPKSEIRIHWIIEKVLSGLRSKLHS